MSRGEAHRTGQHGFAGDHLAAEMKCLFHSWLNSTTTRVRKESDPAARIRAVGVVFGLLHDNLDKLAHCRLGDIRTLRSTGLSYEDIASLTELSSSRVAQLARLAGTTPPPPGH